MFRILLLVVLSVSLAAPIALGQIVEDGGGPGPVGPASPNESMTPREGSGANMSARLPLAFVENRGQWDTAAKFVARRGPMLAGFEEDAILLQARKGGGSGGRVVVRLSFEGASKDVVLSGRARQLARRNYFLGRDPSKWQTDVPSYARVVYRGLYDGVDLRVREEAGQLEYDVLLAPGADLSQVVIRCDGIEGLDLEPDGSLVMQTALGPIRQKPPLTWQTLPTGERQARECRFCKVDETRYGFQVMELDPSLGLVIDPGLEWATYLGGSDRDIILAAAVDDISCIVTVVGLTQSTDFPTTPGAYDTTPDEIFEDGFVSRFSPDGSTLLWSTVLGGIAGHDRIFDLSVDDTGVVTVAGQTFSDDFPTTVGAYDESYNLGGDAFIARLDPSADGAAQLEWSTFLGAMSVERAVALDTVSGVVTVAGYTESGNFPVTPGAYDESHNGGLDVFVARLDPSRTGAAQLVWATYLGGNNNEGLSDFDFAINEDLMDIAVRESTGDAYVAGYTASANFPHTPGAYDTTYNGGTADGFLSQLSADGTSLRWSTFLGGGGFNTDDAAIPIAVDDTSGEVTTAGLTRSPNFPTTGGAFQTVPAGDADAFVARLDPLIPGAGQLIYSSRLGGPDFDGVIDMGVDESGLVSLTGGTGNGFPTTRNAYDTDFNGGQDGFVARMRLQGGGNDDLLYSTYLGGPLVDRAHALALCGPDDVVVAGVTISPDFPVTDGAYDVTHNGDVDGWVARLDLCPADFDHSGDVGVTDLLALLGAWGTDPGGPPDIDGGGVGVTDLLLLLGAWGPCRP